MKELIVLYTSEKKDNRQSWALYHSETEADHEYDLMSESDESLEEKSRIWINKTSEIKFYNL